MNELESLIILNNIPLVGAVNIKILLNRFGSASNVLSADLSEIAKIDGFGPKKLEAFRNWPRNESWKRDLELIEKNDIKIIAYKDKKYPQNLLRLDDFPPILYVKGSLKENCFAIVGTRNASRYGVEMAERIGSEMARNSFTVASGLARGIDTAAHRGALRCGNTIAVIGSGLSNLYPRENLRLAEEISKNGAVVSELPMYMPPNKKFFPRRNRIVSGMSKGVLIIEAPLKSGAMITANMAIEQKKQIFALPGRVTDVNFQGNHRLIKEKKAILIEDSKDIICYFGGNFVESKSYGSSAKNLSAEEKKILAILSDDELTIDEIQQEARINISALSVLLMGLVMKGAIKEYPGKVYNKV